MELKKIEADLRNLVEAERGRSSKQPMPEFLFSLFCDALTAHGISSGTVAEIGGAKNSLMDRLDNFAIRYLSLYPSADPRFVTADITNCPHIPDESFDGIYSVSVLEHVTRIHDAAREIVRLLRPGGITMHAVPFSYFFHGAPVDFWRLTTTALETLFAELTTIDCFFYSDNRRRNNLGSPANRIDQDGGPQFAPDAFGGWRENWFTVYVGRKSIGGAELFFERRTSQILLNIIKGLNERGMEENEAIDAARFIIKHVSFNEHGRVIVSKTQPAGHLLAPERDQLQSLWKTRGGNTLRPNVDRHNLMAMLAAAGVIR